MAGAEREILRLFDAYAAALFAGDIAAFVALYDADVRVFDLWNAWSYDGIAAWRRTVMEWFGSLGDERVRVDTHEIRTVVTGELAIASAFVTYTGLATDGSPRKSMDNRLTWGLRRRGDRWVIVHEHTSTPIDPETRKLIRRREPST